jgi:hypothetical protein
MTATSSILKPWKRPPYYGGATWNGWLVAPVSTNRDADALTRSNFDRVRGDLEDTPDVELTNPDDGEPCNGWRIVHERHWAVGWIEWLAIHPDATEARKVAEDAAVKLADYPILDEELFSMYEDEENES